jgi:hypothetical protein
MRYLLLLLLSSCATVNVAPQNASIALMEKAKQSCKDDKRCALEFLYKECRTKNLDLKICGLMEKL